MALIKDYTNTELARRKKLAAEKEINRIIKEKEELEALITEEEKKNAE